MFIFQIDHVLSEFSSPPSSVRYYVVGIRHLQDELAAGSHGTMFHSRPPTYYAMQDHLALCLNTATKKIKREGEKRDQSRYDQSAKLF
jgi:hypothetical protein